LNRDRPLRTGFGNIPNALWTLPDLTPNQRCLLGWLHSHADNYLSGLTLNRIGREYGGGKRAADHIRQLQDAGWVELIEAAPGHPARVVLLSEPWEQLLYRSQDVTTTGHETEPVPVTKRNHHRSQNVTTEKNNSRTTDESDQMSNARCGFDDWWEQYPRKVAKKDAAKAWAQMSVEDRTMAATMIGEHVALWAREGRGTTKVPYPATWLRRESWHDELGYIPDRKQTGGLFQGGSIMDRLSRQDVEQRGRLGA